MAEKRDQHRHKKRLQTRFGRETTKKMAFTSDLSTGGLFVITGQPEAPGSRVLLELILPHQETIRAIGQVRWAKKVPANLFHVAKKAGMGIQIKNIENGQEVFLDYLASLKA